MATIVGTSGNDNLRGTAGNDSIFGLAGHDIINGLAGIDTMAGGAGNDIYYVDSTSDVVTEGMDAGNDWVYASVDYGFSAVIGGVSDHPSANVDNLQLLGSAYYGLGNALNNSIVGNDGNNYLWGGAGNDVIDGNVGNDTMVGGIGNDTYSVNNTSDVVTEGVGDGTDSVYASASYTLSANVENLYLKYSAFWGIYGGGNELDNYIEGNTDSNRLWGNAGNDTISGGDGNDSIIGGDGNDSIIGGARSDVLTGGAGADYFTFNFAGNGIDTITDFRWQELDQIVLSSSGFGNLQTSGGYLAPSEFGTRILYNASTGALSFDRDGTGTVSAPVQIATLSTKPILISSDFLVIA